VRTNYVLIDFENVQPNTLDDLAHDHFKVFVFVGANQTKVPLDFAVSMQSLGSRAQYIKISSTGRNTLDFHIAYYIGQFAAADESAYFHVVSKDQGFDSLIEHLKSKKLFAGRVEAIADIPLVKATNAKSATERIEVILDKLERLKDAKPRSLKKLHSTIDLLFQKQLPDEEIEALVQKLEAQDYLSRFGTKITYALPSNS
jgi:hypothetical protein